MMLSAALLLPGCETTGGGSAKPNFLVPGPPSYLQPVAVRKRKAGESWPVVSARYEVGLEEANGIIVSGRRDWSTMSKTARGNRK